MDPFIIEYTNSSRQREFLRHEMEEFFVLLEGEIDFRIFDDSHPHLMKVGDTVYLKANIPHRVVLADGCEHARAFAVYADPAAVSEEQ